MRAMLAIEQSGLDIALAMVCAVVPWLPRRLRGWALEGGLIAGLGMSFVASVLALPLYPWSDLVVALVALVAGLLLGRGLPPRAGPMLWVLLGLSALDILQIALTGGLTPVPLAAPPPHPFSAPGGPLLYGNFLLPLPGGHYLIGIFDLLILTAIAEHRRRRGGGYPLAVAPGIIGFLLADALFWLTRLGGWPLIPFFTAGWLCVEGIARVVPRRDRAAGKAA